MNLVDDLRAATADPPPTRIDIDGLIATARHRAVRRRWVAAACAVVLTATASVGLVRLTSLADSDRGRVATTLPDFADLPRPEQVWPDAVRRIPDRLPDGRPYRLHAILDDDTLLVTPDLAAASLEGPIVFDPVRGTARDLLDTALLDGTVPLDVMPGIVGGSTIVDVNGDEAVWLLPGVRDGEQAWEFWAARLDGSVPARRLARLTDPIDTGVAVEGFRLTGEAAYWTSNGAKGRNGRIAVLQLSDGSVAHTPGWAATLLSGWVTDQDQLAPAASGELWNMVTDERLRWRANADATAVACDPVACYGSAKDGGGPVTHGLDGGGLRRLPATVRVHGGFAFDGRFAVGDIVAAGDVDSAPGPDARKLPRLVWDRFTGKAAASPGGGATAFIAGTATRPLFIWQDGDGQRMALDLAAVE